MKVQIGLAILEFDGPTIRVAVDSKGTARAVLLLPTTSFRERRFGVAGSCVPNDFVVSEQVIGIIPRDATRTPETPATKPTPPPVPGPPDAGSGMSTPAASASPGIPLILMGLAILGGPLVLTATVRRRRPK